MDDENTKARNLFLGLLSAWSSDDERQECIDGLWQWLTEGDVDMKHLRLSAYIYASGSLGSALTEVVTETSGITLDDFLAMAVEAIDGTD